MKKTNKRTAKRRLQREIDKEVEAQMNTEDRVIEKLYAGKELMPIECKMCADGGVGTYVDEIEEDKGRWVRYMKTIFKIGADLWAVEWGRGLTEMQENEYCWQPYRVKEIRKQITITTVEYEKVTE